MKEIKKNAPRRKSPQERHGLYFGSVSFHGYGGFPEKMISQLLGNGIRLRRVRTSGVEISGIVSPYDYPAVARAAHENGIRIKSGKRMGIYFTLSRYENRIGLYVGLLTFVLILSIFQTHVQDISIEGDVSHGQILSILEECGITVGADKRLIRLSQAEQQIMLEVEDCAWVDVSCVGYRVNVTVQKGTPAPEMQGDSPRNIVASRAAVIVKEVVRQGETVLSVGSGVQQGGLIVSGTMSDGGGSILFVHADAEIIGEFTETEEFFVPYNETVSIADGEETRFKYLVFNDDVYPLFLGEAYVDNAVYSEEASPLRLFGAETPFMIRSGIFTKYRQVDVVRSPDDCTSELKRLKSDYEENFLSEYEIVAVTEKYLPEEDGIRLILEYTLRGDIAEPVDIEVG